jgi:gamma-glutamylcyclotransferase (GGCT)/AIG2-like uncharacterized protein YtfP
VENLFSYGTLRDEKVQRSVFDRGLSGTPDAIIGYRLRTVTITDPKSIAISGHAEHHILEPTGQERDQIEGMVFQLNEKELGLVDAYEDKAYKRAKVRLRSGTDAWVYVRA